MKKKSVLNSPKPYRNPKWLGPQDKVDNLGPILGAKPKKSKVLSNKFMGCSIERDGKMISEDEKYLNYTEFANASKAKKCKCPVCKNEFKNIHSKDQKYCSSECENKGTLVNKLQEAFNKSQIRKAGVIPFYRDNKGVIRMMFVKSSDPAYGGSNFQIAK